MVLGKQDRGTALIVSQLAGTVCLIAVSSFAIRYAQSYVSFLSATAVGAFTLTLVRSRWRLLIAGDSARQENSDLRTFADSVPQVLWGTRADGYCDFLNARYSEVFGISTEEAIRNQTWVSPIHPEDRSKMYDVWRNALDTGASEYRAYARFRFHDGCYRWMQSVGRSVRSRSTGEIERWFGSLLDVDAEVQSQEKIERLNAELRTVTDEQAIRLAGLESRVQFLSTNQPVGTCEEHYNHQVLVRHHPAPDERAVVSKPADWPPHGGQPAFRIISFNSTFLSILGYGDITEFVNDRRTGTSPIEEVHTKVAQALIEGSDRISGTVEIARRDGSHATLAYAARVEPEGRVETTIIDLAEREVAQRHVALAKNDLERANRVLAAGALSISLLHEINQPLTAMTIDLATAARLADSQKPNLPVMRKLVERLRRNTNRLSEITGGAREKIRNHHRTLERLDLIGVANNAVHLLERETNDRQAAISTSSSGPNPIVIADRLELQQVFVNLLLNALDAVGDAVGERLIHLTFDTSETLKSTLISIVDNGPGFSEEALRRMFEPFFSSKPNGLGFGLQICRTTVEALGGEIRVANLPKGGAKIAFTLPIA